jgi:sulfite exporter TauE/SafE
MRMSGYGAIYLHIDMDTMPFNLHLYRHIYAIHNEDALMGQQYMCTFGIGTILFLILKTARFETKNELKLTKNQQAHL